MTTFHSRPGEDVQIGVCIGFMADSSLRWGRLVGIRKDDCRPIEKYIIRKYNKEDGEYPTGGYSTTSIMALVPHTRYGCP